LGAACDQGHQDDQAVAGAPIHITDANILGGKTIPPDGRIEIAFDRLLMPSSVTRQTFILSDKRGSGFTPEVSYDPVARVVTLTPDRAFEDMQFYVLRIATPQSSADVNGLRAIDGATLDLSAQAPITFEAVAATDGGTQPQPPVVDFCRDIEPLFSNCSGASCHTSAAKAAEGLVLDSPQDIAATAVGRVAQESNTGPRSAPQPPNQPPIPVFGVDMPILDPGTGPSTAGDPANSWLVYKLLMAVPGGQPNVKQPALCDGGAPAPPAMGPMHMVMWQPLSDAERATLSNLVPGREMPYPDDPSAPLSPQVARALTLDEMQLVSRWIAQPRAMGAPLVPQTCPVCIP
jgi:hypothetical protein